MAREKYIVILLLTTLFVTTLGITGNNTVSAGTEKEISNKWAILIGISDYPGTSNDLNNPHRDALIMNWYLSDVAGFPKEHVRLFLNDVGTRENVLGSLQWLVDNTDENSQVVFWYSGHGTMTVANDGRVADSAICLYDGNLWGYEMGEILINLKSNHAFFGIDACMAGWFNYDDTIPVLFDNLGIAGEGHVVVTSSSEATLSWDGVNYGAFTYSFVVQGLIQGCADGWGETGDILGEQDAKVSIQEAFWYAFHTMPFEDPLYAESQPRMNDQYGIPMYLYDGPAPMMPKDDTIYQTEVYEFSDSTLIGLLGSQYYDYKFPVKHGATKINVKLTWTPQAEDAYDLEVYDPDGNEVASSGAAVNTPEETTFVPVKTGDYVARAVTFAAVATEHKMVVTVYYPAFKASLEVDPLYITKNKQVTIDASVFHGKGTENIAYVSLKIADHKGNTIKEWTKDHFATLNAYTLELRLSYPLKRKGPWSISLTAEDNDNNRIFREVTVNKGKAPTETLLNKWAVLVGLADYPGTANDLPNFTVETYWIYDYLVKLGYPEEHIIILTDELATKNNTKEALQWLVDNCDNSSEVVFHYNGHGGLLIGTTEEGENNVQESNICTYDEWLWSGEMKQILEPLTPKQFVLVFDCCVAGNFAGGTMVTNETLPFVEAVAGPNRIVATASTQFTLGWMDNSGWGEFGRPFWREALGDNLGDTNLLTGNNDGWTSVEEAWWYAKTRINAYNLEASPTINDQYPGEMFLGPPLDEDYYSASYEFVGVTLLGIGESEVLPKSYRHSFPVYEDAAKAEVLLTWNPQVEDAFDLYVYDPNGKEVGGSGQFVNTAEKAVFIPTTWGSYTATAKAYLAVAVTYKLTATIYYPTD